MDEKLTADELMSDLTSFIDSWIEDAERNALEILNNDRT